MLQIYGSWNTPSDSSSQEETEHRIGKLTCRNRIGIAAGFDKDGIAINGLHALGLGFIEVGAITPKAQAGNAKPRLFRLREDRALINRLGFNNNGVDALVRRLRTRKPSNTPIGVNIGKNKITPLESALDDYIYCLERVYDLVDFVTINASSPNTEGLRRLGGSERGLVLYRKLVDRKNEIAVQSKRDIAFFVKLSPDMDLDAVAELAIRLENIGYDGVIATNTTETRMDLRAKYKNERGGLSGAPLLERALKCVGAIRAAVSDNFVIIGSGGVSDQHSAQLMFDAGADLIQIYTGLVFEGPECIRNAMQAIPRIHQSA